MSIIGLDIGGTNIKAGLVRNGKIIERTRVPTHAGSGPERSIAQIKTAVRRFIDRGSAVGIGIAGIIDSDRGIVKFSPNFCGWTDIKLGPLLSKEFKKKVKILNDVNAVLLGEWQYGAGKGHKNVFLFTLGTGVGGAAVCEGQMVFGANGFAGEFGHVVIDFKGPACACGGRGCLESYVGARRIVSMARKRLGKKSPLKHRRVLTPKMIADAAKKGDRCAREVFSEIGNYLGIAVGSMINLLDPEVIIVSGGIARAGKMLFDPLRDSAARCVVGAKYRAYKIVPARLGDDAGILGAAFFASHF
jgi:glucokinase